MELVPVKFFFLIFGPVWNVISYNFHISSNAQAQDSALNLEFEIMVNSRNVYKLL